MKPISLHDSFIDTLGVYPQSLFVSHSFSLDWPKYNLGGGFKYFLFSPLPEGMIQVDEHTFQMG